jgi:hypothetical protein
MIDIQKLGGPAFPVKSPIAGDFAGMSMRDYFAAKAMNGLMSLPLQELTSYASLMQKKDVKDFVVDVAYEVADAMLKAREE